jgi:hypothetical protein
MEEIFEAEGTLNSIKDDVKNEKCIDATQVKVLYGLAVATLANAKMTAALVEQIQKARDERAPR